ncbi:MAG TPA: DUF3344 domain-containing protein, partial [Methanoregulaceae archaeon]|nr:DUF3344 domain-containing protein [Methanoregulaceae archaeon]
MNKRKSIVIVILCIFLVGLGSSTTLPLSTTQTGTVSGDLYVGAFQNPAWHNQSSAPGVKEFTQSFSIPAYTTIQWARLETVVYAAGTDTRHGQTTVEFDGNGDGTYETLLGLEDQQIASSTDGEVYSVNDHMDRCYSDYRIWYNVTGLITTQTPAVYVKTENLDGSTFDGRVKEITLIIAYNDGDSDQVMYWVNTGHDYQASSAAGVTTSFNTTSVPPGFTAAMVKNVGLASKDAQYTFNTLTPIGANPVYPYNYFEANSWDVTSGITAGAASTFGYTNNGSSFKTTLATLTVRSALVEHPDLTVTDIKPNVGAGGYLFANEPNAITVTVKNNGLGESSASTISVNVTGNTYTAIVGALAAGATSMVTVTDTVSHTGGSSVTVTATADATGIVSESDETNNSLTSTPLTVYDNGYKGKRWTGGSDMNTQATFNGRYGLVYSTGNSVYTSTGWSSSSTTWTPADLPIPGGATIESARLYQGYTFDQTSGGNPLLTVTFNGATVTPGATYTDRKGYGSYDYPSGQYVYNVTGQFDPAGNSMTITAETGNNNGIYGAYLVVVYQDASTTVKSIWINDECDMLYAGAVRSVSNDEGTAYAGFPGIDTTGVSKATLIAAAPSANEADKSKVFLNSVDLGDLASGYLSGPQVSLKEFDVLSALASGSNEVRLQSYIVSGSGDNMVVTNAILVVEKTEITEAPIAAFSGSPLIGTAPHTVSFTDTSTGDITSRSWDFGDGATSTAQNSSHVYTNAGTYTVNLTVTGPGGSDSEVKTNYITVTAAPVAPVAQYTANTTSGTPPLSVQFTDQSTGTVTGYAWDFTNDGVVDSTAKNASFTYSTTGTYTVNHTVTGPGGSDSEVKTNYITVTAAPVA